MDMKFKMYGREVVVTKVGWSFTVYVDKKRIVVDPSITVIELSKIVAEMK